MEQPSLDRFASEQEAICIPGLSTQVREAQEVEGLRFAQAPLLPPGRLRPGAGGGEADRKRRLVQRAGAEGHHGT